MRQRSRHGNPTNPLLEPIAKHVVDLRPIACKPNPQRLDPVHPSLASAAYKRCRALRRLLLRTMAH